MTRRIADDYPSAADLVALVLGHEGRFETMVAYDGVQALRMALETLPCALLLDVEMPGLSGIEVARRVREVLGEKRPMLLAITGRAPDDALLSQVFDHVFVKPLDFDKLDFLLAQA